MLLIKNGFVYTMEQEDGSICDVLMDGDKIIKVAQNIEADGAVVIDATGKKVYPGLVESHSHIGIWESSIGFEGTDGNEMSEPVTPHVRAIDGINPMDETIRLANESGVTTVCVTPGSANVVGGQVAIFKTYGNCIDDMLLDPYSAMKVAFGENPKRVYQNSGIKTRMRTAQLLRELLFKTIEYQNKQNAAQDDVSKRPAFDMKLEAMLPVINKEVPLKIHAHRADDILTALRIVKEFDLEATLDHCTEGHLIIDQVVNSKFPALVGPSLSHKSKFELKNLTFDTPGILNKAGVKISIITDATVVPQQYLSLCAGLAVKAGLDEYEALKAITINAAEILKQGHRIGSIKEGKDADIVITDANILDSRTNVLYTITNGEITFKA